MKKSRFTDSQIMDALKRAEAGLAVPELCRELGISSATFYKWRAKYALRDADGNMYKIDAADIQLDADDAEYGKVTIDFDADGWAAAKADYETDVEAGLAGTANPLAALDKALQTVDDLRSHLGAIQNRFESTIANLNNTVNNLSAARSRIEDADYAVEVSNMTRAQILQQAGTSVLAQANQVPQGVLSLLR